MSLNIKNPETCRLAEELAELTKENKTQAITIALQERLERESSRRKERIESMLAYRNWVRPRTGPGPSAKELFDSMYGEYGEPV